MEKDPILEEIHETRQKLLNECDGDLTKYMDRLKADELTDKERIVSKKEIEKDEKKKAI